MPTAAQLAANRRNAQHSTGPKTAKGKENIELNNFRHGLAGGFHFLRWEKVEDFDELLAGLLSEHEPETPTEQLLVERMAQHEWLRRRAQVLQHICFREEGFLDPNHEKEFALYLRYQTTHERSFHKCLNELLKLRAERRKQRMDEAALSKRAEDSRKAFESQKAREADQARKAELHAARIRLANAKAARVELETNIQGTIQTFRGGADDRVASSADRSPNSKAA